MIMRMVTTTLAVLFMTALGVALWWWYFVMSEEDRPVNLNWLGIVVNLVFCVAIIVGGVWVTRAIVGSSKSNRSVN